METIWFWSFFSVVFINMVEGITPSINYLYGGARMSSNYYDYYFCCNVKGQFLDWLVNGDSIGGFLTENSGSVSIGSHLNFIHFSALLSKTEVPSGHQYDSILILSLLESPENLNLNISCESDLESSFTTTNRMQRNNINGTKSGLVYMQPLFSGQVIPSLQDTTYGFVCRVGQETQTWTINNQDQDGLGFNTFDDVGYRLPIRSGSSSIATWDTLAFICEVESNEIISVLFVTGSPGMNVTCSSGVDSAYLYTDNLSTQGTSTTTHSSTPSRSSATTITETTSSSVMPTSLEAPFSQLLVVIPVVVVSLLLVIILVGVLIIIIRTRKKIMAAGRKPPVQVVKPNGIPEKH